MADDECLGGEGNPLAINYFALFVQRIENMA